MKIRLLISLLLAWLVLGTAGCGNKGDLYLPDDEDEKAERKDY